MVGAMNWLEIPDPDDRLLGRCLRRQADENGDTDFLIEDTTHFTFARANEVVNGFARGFAELGVSKGDPVAFLMGSGADVVFSALALNKLGAIWTPANTEYKGVWLEENLRAGGAKLLVADADLLANVAALDSLPFERVLVRGEPRVDLPVPVEPLEAFADLIGDEPDDSDLHSGDPACIQWTSGTTGRAKGVIQNHNVWIRAADIGARTAGLREGDVIHNCLPLYHSGAWVANIFRALVTGVPCGLDPSFSVGEFWDRTRHYGATMVFTLGAMHMFLWNQPERDDDADNPVRVASFIPLPEDMVPGFKERFGIDEIFQGYGQSECMASISRVHGRTYKPNSLGEVVDGVEVALLDDRDVPVAVGETGELCIRPTEPDAIFSGYWQNPAATVEAWRNLWYHSGDLMRCDADDEYFFVDRKQDFIRYKGRNISSFAVEATVNAHPAVAESAAHGVVSAELEAEAEMKVCVVLVAGESLTAEELCRFVNDNAPYFFVPRYVEFIVELPRTPTDRVRKYQLRERGVTADTWDGIAAGFEIRR